jgi:hypothetical protein
MQNAIVVTGRLVGPKNVELDEPVLDANAVVQVIVRPGGAAPQEKRNIVDFLHSLGAGTRSKEEIDRALASERDAWERAE